MIATSLTLHLDLRSASGIVDARAEEGNRSLSYRELAPKLADYVNDMGFTHVELLPVMEHPFFGSWDTKSPATTLPARASERRKTSCTWSIICTNTTSVSSWTGCHRIS